jgi:hypothetical protein
MSHGLQEFIQTSPKSPISPSMVSGLPSPSHHHLGGPSMSSSVGGMTNQGHIHPLLHSELSSGGFKTYQQQGPSVVSPQILPHLQHSEFPMQMNVSDPFNGVGGSGSVHSKNSSPRESSSYPPSSTYSLSHSSFPLSSSLHFNNTPSPALSSASLTPPPPSSVSSSIPIPPSVNQSLLSGIPSFHSSNGSPSSMSSSFPPRDHHHYQQQQQQSSNNILDTVKEQMTSSLLF